MIEWKPYIVGTTLHKGYYLTIEIDGDLDIRWISEETNIDPMSWEMVIHLAPINLPGEETP